MLLEINREDLINLVKGTTPSYALMDLPIVSKLGSYTGGHNDRWDWDYNFPDSITDLELYSLYIKLKGK